MIKERDGIHIEQEKKIVADSRRTAGDINFVSHAHADHLHQGDSEVVCSDTTAALASARTGKDIDYSDSHERIELLSSGHIVGSRAAVVEGEKTVLYTGDVSIQDRLYLDGFQPVEADVLVVESTFGIPAYSLPPQERVVDNIKEWMEEEQRPLMLFGYSLGRAQKLQYIAEEASDRPILVHGAVEKMNHAVEESTDLEFNNLAYTDNREKLENGILIAPSRLSNSDWADKVAREFNAVKAGFSGWAANSSFKYRGGYDRVFPLSDHCGFEDLVSLVEKVDPDKVYTHHGFDEAFTSYLKREKNYNARALKNNQSSLDEF